MATVLVTGGTGTLGRVLVPRLVAAGHEVRVLSRRERPRLPEGVQSTVGDVRAGVGVSEAVAGCDVVVHAATSPLRHARQTEIEGARHVSAAATTAGAHLVYVSIVGVDQHRYTYYRAKFAAEQVITSSDAQWTVLRATQFHDLLDRILSWPMFIRTPRLAFQVVDAGDVADRLVEIVGGGALGLAPDFGGPDVVPVTELADARARITGRRTRLVRVPRVGSLRDFDDGLHLTPEHRDGRVTWERWLQTRGRRTPPG